MVLKLFLHGDVGHPAEQSSREKGTGFLVKLGIGHLIPDFGGEFIYFAFDPG